MFASIVKAFAEALAMDSSPAALVALMLVATGSICGACTQGHRDQQLGDCTKTMSQTAPQSLYEMAKVPRVERACDRASGKEPRP